MAIIFIIIILLGVILLVFARMPGEYNIEDAVIIRKGLIFVRDTVSDLRFYTQWSPLTIFETDYVAEIIGKPKTVGHSCIWKSKKSGGGNVTIRGIDDCHVHFELNISFGKLSTRDNWFFEEWGDGETKVTVQNNGSISIPFARFIRKSIINNLHLGIISELTNLKRLCEKPLPAEH